MQSQHQPIRKQHHLWLFYLLAAGLGWVAIFIFEVALLSVLFREFPTPFRVAAVLIPTVVAFGFCLILIMGSKIIPWRYSVLGPYERSPPPKDFHPRICMNVAPSRPQYATRYEVGKEGIELTFAFGSRAFIPAATITAIGPGSWRTYVVEHDCPEIGSPLVVSKDVGEALLAGLERTDTPREEV